MNIVLEQYILNGNTRDKAEFRLLTSAGKANINDITTTYNGSKITGSFGLDVTSALPKIDVKGTLDTFDSDKFFTTDGKPVQPVTPVSLPAPPPVADAAGFATTATASSAAPVLASHAPQWSRKEFDFHWLELLNVTFHVKFDQYKQGIINAHALDVLGGVDNGRLTIESLTGYIMGAQVAGKAYIVGGKIPSINIAANINSVDAVQLTTFFPVLSGMTGKYNLSLRLDSSGIDMISWISSLEGSIGLGGDNVNIHGFNLAAVIHAVAYVRTVADILNVVRRAFPGGDTMFSSIEGQWTVANGVLKTANSKLTNELADGLMTSQVDLVNWKVQTNISLLLKSLDVAHPPGMIITFSGDLDKPEDRTRYTVAGTICNQQDIAEDASGIWHTTTVIRHFFAGGRDILHSCSGDRPCSRSRG